MGITFRIEDDTETGNLRPVMIDALQMGALLETLAEYGERYGLDLIIHDYGSLDEQVFAWEARTAMMPIAVIARHFTFDVVAIALIEIAQFLGRPIRIACRDDEPDIMVTLSSNPDTVLEMTVSTTSHEIALNAIAGSISVGGAAYELWARRFSEACDGYFNSIDSDQLSPAVEIATQLGYVVPSADVEYDPSVCNRSGIDSAYCHCGYHE